VPQYIRDQQAAMAQAKAAAEAAKKEKELGIPPGMVLMPEEQRLNTLAVLQESQCTDKTQTSRYNNGASTRVVDVSATRARLRAPDACAITMMIQPPPFVPSLTRRCALFALLPAPSPAPSCPPFLPSDHKKVLYDISCFPLRVETISRKKAKAELEAKLEEIEKALQLFSRKRVLIQP
jgi:hypothetical protein